jgi:hypothetical protein
MRKLLLSLALLFSTATAISPATQASATGTNSISISDVTDSGMIVRASINVTTSDFLYVYLISDRSDLSQPVYNYGDCAGVREKALIFRVQVGGETVGQREYLSDLRSWAPCGSSSLPIDVSKRDHLLKADTTYFVRLSVVTNVNSPCLWDSSCYSWGSPVQFRTRPAILPVAQTGDASEVDSDAVVLDGIASSGDDPSNARFEYSTSSTFSRSKFSNSVVVIASDVNKRISIPVRGLIENTKYFYRLRLVSSYGESIGQVSSFETLPPVGVSVNDESVFTDSLSVSLRLTWPLGATQVLVSNDGGFRQQKAFDLETKLPWNLVSSGSERIPKTVYVKYVLSDGSRSSVFFDDIIVDTSQPVITQASARRVSSGSGSVKVSSLSQLRESAMGGWVRLAVVGSDSNSGIKKVQVKTSPSGKISSIAVSARRSLRQSIFFRSTKQIFYVRVVDSAGNPSGKWIQTKLQKR